jgi:hypothetical protein
VMDFGIARVLGSEHFTHGGYMMGTPAYMAPEQVLGREIDGRADLYSVGVVLYRLLSGRLPFDADTAISMVQMQISEPPTPIASFRPDLPQWCIAIVERALAKAPADRYQSAEEFRAALLVAAKPQTLGEMPTLATPTPPGLAMESDSTVAQRTPTSTRAIGATPHGQPAAAIATAVVPQVSTTPSPTPTSTERTTTTVVLGRTHLVALASLLVIVGVGIAILIIVALRGPGLPQQIAANTPAASTPQAADASTPPSSAPAPSTGSGTGAPTPTPTPPPAPGAKPATTPPAAGATPPGVATAGATTPAGRGTTPADLAAAQAASTAAGTAARGGRATNAKDAVEASATTPPAPATPATSPPFVSFNQVRVLISDAGKAREREGVLQLFEGRVAMAEQGGGNQILSVPTSSLSGLFYARSKQPKWRDASGKEVESRIDLGPMGFLRGERNWIILLTQGEPVILRIEDSALRTVLPALQERTGLKIQR